MDYDLDAMDMDILLGAQDLLKARWGELVDGYLEDAATYLEALKKGVADNDSDVISFNAHSLKSSSNGLGIIGVGEIAGAIENGVRDAAEEGTSISHLGDLVPLLDDAFQRAIPKLRATIEEGADE
ncbi:MAG: hypothetical protein COB36_02790 [Alphaproteobacteria bacterium]|nr:MAG: hypothetical protein COB36_02790 [Alphaproteobacteria bacterium]